MILKMYAVIQKSKNVKNYNDENIKKYIRIYIFECCFSLTEIYEKIIFSSS